VRHTIPIAERRTDADTYPDTDACRNTDTDAAGNAESDGIACYDDAVLVGDLRG